MPDPDQVCTRFFFIFENKASASDDINTQSLKYKGAIKEAVAFQYC